MLAALSNTTWGWNKRDLVKVYNATIKSRLDYAGAAWQPWLSETNMGVIERTQNKALRLITGQVQNTDVGVLRVEAGITSFKRTRLGTALGLTKKPTDYQRSSQEMALAEATPRRNNRQSWFSRAPSVSKYFNLPCLSERHSIRRYTRDPWSYPNNFSVFNTLGASRTRI